MSRGGAGSTHKLSACIAKGTASPEPLFTQTLPLATAQSRQSPLGHHVRSQALQEPDPLSCVLRHILVAFEPLPHTSGDHTPGRLPYSASSIMTCWSLCSHTPGYMPGVTHFCSAKTPRQLKCMKRPWPSPAHGSNGRAQTWGLVLARQPLSAAESSLSTPKLNF